MLPISLYRLAVPGESFGPRCSSDSPTAAVIPQCLHLPPAAALRDSALRRNRAPAGAQAHKNASPVLDSTVSFMYNSIALQGAG